MKNIFSKISICNSLVWLIATLLLLSLTFTKTQAQLVNVPVTGFNNDIVANGVGTNSVAGLTHVFGVDGAGYYFIDNTYKYTASNALPNCFMPTANLAASTRTAGLTYQLHSYTGNNALTLDNNSTTYTTSPFPNTGALTLTTPASYSKLFVLYETVLNTNFMTEDAIVTFTDASTQTFNNNTCVNWFTPTLPAFSSVGRGTSSGNIECGVQPNLFELQLTLNAVNYGKQVQSISFTIPTQLTAGTFPYSVNYFHAMAVGGQVAPLDAKTINQSESHFSIFPNPASDELNISFKEVKANTCFILFDITGKEVSKFKIENAQQNISLVSIPSGLYYYKAGNENEMMQNGKVVISANAK